MATVVIRIQLRKLDGPEQPHDAIVEQVIEDIEAHADFFVCSEDKPDETQYAVEGVDEVKE